MRKLVYRGMFFLKTTKVPTLFRAIEPWQGTLILDEADLSNDNDSNEFIEYLNARATGTVIPRYSSERDKVDLWVDFGNTIVATRKAYNDDGVNSRTIAMRAEQTTKDIDLIPPPEWLQNARSIQRKLLLWRLRHLAKINSGVLRLPSKIRMKDIASFRVKEAFLILSALKEEEASILEDIQEIAKEIDKRLVEERASSPTGLILSVVYGSITEKRDFVPDGNDFNVQMEKTTAEGEEVIYPLTLKTISDSLGNKFSNSEIARYWRGLGQTIKDQERVDGKKHRGLILIHDPIRLDREFKKYVVNAEVQFEVLYKKQNKLDVALGGTTDTSGTVTTQNDKVVPPVPLVPPDSTPMEKELSKAGKGTYFRVTGDCSIQRNGQSRILKVGATVFLYHNEAARLIQEGLIALACPNGNWDPNEKSCIISEVGSL